MEVGSASLKSLFSRRSFVRLAGLSGAALGTDPLHAAQPNVAVAPIAEDYYAKLGVPTIINAAGTYTTLTAACMPPEVVAAVQRAALHPVRLHDLQVKSGEYLARRLRCEGAVVTSGASGAISLATAACILHANPGLGPLDLPQKVNADRTGTIKNQVVVQRAHRYGYDHAMFLCGARVTEVVTMDDYKRACSKGDAVMTNFFNAADDEVGPEGPAQIGREE